MQPLVGATLAVPFAQLAGRHQRVALGQGFAVIRALRWRHCRKAEAAGGTRVAGGQFCDSDAKAPGAGGLVRSQECAPTCEVVVTVLQQNLSPFMNKMCFLPRSYYRTKARTA